MNEQSMLFASLPDSAAVTELSATAEPAPRVLLAERNQIELRAVDLDATISSDHPARSVWAFVERLDLSALYGAISSVEGRAGRPAIDPGIVMALWLYATVDGVGSAREIERLTEAHDAYRWICGGVNVNHHTLSDFRCARVDLLDEWLTHSGGVDGAGLGEAGARGAGRDAGASQRRGGLFSAPLDIGALYGRSPSTSSSAQG